MAFDVKTPLKTRDAMTAADDRIVDELRSLLAPDRVAGPVPLEAVAAAERELKVSFPRAYRLFLLHFGAALLPGREIVGIDPNYTDPEAPPLYRNVVQVTLRGRRVSRGYIPDSLIPISSDGCDDTFYLDTAADSGHGEAPVVVHGPGRDGIRVADTFVDFVELLLSGAV